MILKTRFFRGIKLIHDFNHNIAQKMCFCERAVRMLLQMLLDNYKCADISLS